MNDKCNVECVSVCEREMNDKCSNVWLSASVCVREETHCE